MSGSCSGLHDGFTAQLKAADNTRANIRARRYVEPRSDIYQKRIDVENLHPVSCSRATRPHSNQRILEHPFVRRDQRRPRSHSNRSSITCARITSIWWSTVACWHWASQRAHDLKDHGALLPRWCMRRCTSRWSCTAAIASVSGLRRHELETTLDRACYPRIYPPSPCQSLIAERPPS